MTDGADQITVSHNETADSSHLTCSDKDSPPGSTRLRTDGRSVFTQPFRNLYRPCGARRAPLGMKPGDVRPVRYTSPWAPPVPRPAGRSKVRSVCHRLA
jgi:hypothetical protein